MPFFLHALAISHMLINHPPVLVHFPHSDDINFLRRRLVDATAFFTVLSLLVKTSFPKSSNASFAVYCLAYAILLDAIFAVKEGL